MKKMMRCLQSDEPSKIIAHPAQFKCNIQSDASRSSHYKRWGGRGRQI
ncbi:unnamed protein product [Amoebophrya sp. A120]|nr:unnamed protein product [Amoebophrya sp. A120]|eukprot:GSA120T00010341001.1